MAGVKLFLVMTLVGSVVALVTQNAAMSVLAQTDPHTPWTVPYGEWGALGVLCFVVVWIVTKTAPSFIKSLNDLTTDHKQVMSQMGTDHRVAIEHVAEEHKRNIQDVLDRLERREQARDSAVTTMAAAVNTMASNCKVAGELLETRRKQEDLDRRTS